MIDTMTIEGYRAIEKLTIHPKRINILVGANNSGKSSILEILSLLCTIQSGFIDKTGINTWNYLIGTKKYDPASLIHTNSPFASISIFIPAQKITLKLSYSESGYEDREVGGKITEGLLTLSDSYLLSTDILSTIIQQGKKNRSSSGFNRMSFNTGSFDVSHDEEDDEIQVSAINKIKENIAQIAYQSSKTTIQLIDNDTLACLFADVRMAEYLKNRPQGFHAATAGIEKIISGIRSYYQWEGNQYESPSAIRMRTVSDISYISTLFEKMLADGSIRNFEKVIQDKIPYVEDIRKSQEKGILVYLKGEPIPRSLTSMGDGFTALVEILAMNTLVRDGTIIMEEPENNLHPGFIDIFSEQILKDTSNNQYFISTHSSDLIETILERAKHTQKLQDIRLIILHKHMHLTYPVAEEMTGEEALDEIETIHSDLRGI